MTLSVQCCKSCVSSYKTNLLAIFHHTVRKKHAKETQNEEPEWFTYGPSSQFETMELRGFDDDEEVAKRGTHENSYSCPSYNLVIIKKRWYILFSVSVM